MGIGDREWGKTARWGHRALPAVAAGRGGHAGTRDPTGGGFIETALPAVAQERALPIPESLKTEGGFLG